MMTTALSCADWVDDVSGPDVGGGDVEGGDVDGGDDDGGDVGGDDDVGWDVVGCSVGCVAVGVGFGLAFAFGLQVGDGDGEAPFLPLEPDDGWRRVPPPLHSASCAFRRRCHWSSGCQTRRRTTRPARSR